MAEERCDFSFQQMLTRQPQTKWQVRPSLGQILVVSATRQRLKWPTRRPKVTWWIACKLPGSPHGSSVAWQRHCWEVTRNIWQKKSRDKCRTMSYYQESFSTLLTYVVILWRWRAQGAFCGPIASSRWCWLFVCRWPGARYISKKKALRRGYPWRMDWGGHDPATPIAEMCHGLYTLNSFGFILDLDILDSFRFLCLFSSEFQLRRFRSG